MYPFIILCGGFATRLGEIAVETPKCLLKLNNKPFLLYQLEYLDKNPNSDGITIRDNVAHDVAMSTFYDALSRMKITYKKRAKI